MGVILVDFADDTHDLAINWWNWRPILAFLRESSLIDDEQFERMGANGCRGRLSVDEALRVAAFLRCQVIPRMNEGERMHADGQISVAPQEPRSIPLLSTHELYAAHKTAVESFASFCEASQGFNVC